MMYLLFFIIQENKDWRWSVG